MLPVIPKTFGEIAAAIKGEIDEKPEKDIKSLVIDSIAKSPENSTESDLVLVFDQKYFKSLSEIKAKALILPSSVKSSIPSPSIPVIWVSRPRLVLKKLLELFSKEKFKPLNSIHPTAQIDSKSKIARTCSIGSNVFVGPETIIGNNTVIYPNVYIGANVVIGDNCILNPNCNILDDCKIGNNVIIYSGAVIGSDGYSFVTEEESNLEKARKGNFNFNFGRQIQHKIPSTGGVIIEDDVEIGANTCIDSGTIGPTVIGAGTKIDNLVMVAHNCNIGKDCLIVAQVGIAGSVILGDRVIAGGQSGFADNITVGTDAMFIARSAVHGHISSNSVYIGYPAVPYKDFIKSQKEIRRLPKRYEKLEQQIKELETKLKEFEDRFHVKV